MKLFNVIKMGVYRHRGGGIFDSFEKAKAAAIKLASLEHDNHHSFDVYELSLNIIDISSRAIIGDDDSDCLFSVRKDDE